MTNQLDVQIEDTVDALSKAKPLVASADAIILDECNEWFNLLKYIVDMKNENYPYIDMIPD